MNQKLAKGFMEITDAIFKCIEMNNEIKERDAREKASRAASEVYDAVMREELGYNPTSYSSSVNRNLRVEVPAKTHIDGRSTEKCSIYCRAKDVSKMRASNPSIFMRNYHAEIIEFPYDVEAYIIQSESKTESFEYRVTLIICGKMRTLCTNTAYKSDKLSAELELSRIKNRIYRDGFFEI